jgi:hypothetical protein
MAFLIYYTMSNINHFRNRLKSQKYYARIVYFYKLCRTFVPKISFNPI